MLEIGNACYIKDSKDLWLILKVGKKDNFVLVQKSKGIKKLILKKDIIEIFEME